MKLSLMLAVLALAGCSLLNSPPASAGTSVITWTNAPDNTDGSLIVDDGVDESSYSSWRIEFGTCVGGAFGVKGGEIVRTRVPSSPSLTTATVNTQSGLRCFRVSATNKAGNESAVSNVASRTVPAPTPKAPTNVTAT